MQLPRLYSSKDYRDYRSAPYKLRGSCRWQHPTFVLYYLTNRRQARCHRVTMPRKTQIPNGPYMSEEAGRCRLTTPVPSCLVNQSQDYAHRATTLLLVSNPNDQCT